MKFFLALTIMMSSSAFSQILSMSEALEVIDQHGPQMLKSEIGMTYTFDSHEQHANCSIMERTHSTLVEENSDFGIVYNEKTTTDCEGTEKVFQFLSHDHLLNLDFFKSMILKEFSDWKIELRSNILTFSGKVATSTKTFQFDLNSPLFINWVHYHHSYPGVEDHNIRYKQKNKMIPYSEVKHHPLCQRELFTLDIISCGENL